MAISCHIARSITEFDPACWDALAGSEISLTHAWQRVMEASRTSYRPLYVLLRDERGPLASAIVSVSESFGDQGWRKQALQRLPLVVRGPLSSASCGIGLRPGIDPAAALPELERVLSKLCRQNFRPLWGVSNVTAAGLPFWRARGFLAAAQRMHTVLDLPPGYETYLAQLPAKYRTKILRTRRRAERFAVSLVHSPLAGEQEQLYALLREVAASHDMSVEAMPFTPAFFSAIEREMSEAAQLFKGFVGGEFAGYLLCLRYDSSLWWLVAGLHYELARPSYLYFLLMDEMIRWSCAHGVQRIYGGMTTEPEKQKHGFCLRERWFCYRAQPRFLHNALRVAASLARRAPAADEDRG